MKKLLFILSIAFLSFGSFAQHQVSKSFNNVSSIDVDGFFCDVTIKVSTGNTVEFTGNVTSKEALEDLKIKYSQNGSELKIWLETPKRRSYSASGIFDLKIPSNTNVTVNTVSGDIIASNLDGKSIFLESVSGGIRSTNALSNINVESVSGGVLVQGVKGNLMAKTVSGSLDITDVAGSLNGSSVSGSVIVRNVNGSTRVSSTSGRLEIADINSRLYANTTSGKITIRDVDGDVECKSVSGGVQLANVVGALNVKTTSGSIKGENVTVTGNTDFDTMSGSINMQLNNANKLSYNLESFSGSLKAMGSSSKRNLYIEKASIWVKGKTFSGSQSYM